MNEENKQALLKFRRDREWENYHTPLNLIHAIGSEFGELSRLFQWGKNPKAREVAEEIADMLIYLEYLADEFCLDTNDEVKWKIQMNAKKYPVDQDNEAIFGWQKP